MRVTPSVEPGGMQGALRAHLRRGAVTVAALAALLVLGACSEMKKPTPQASSAPNAVAVFAGGCFWCIEQDFEKLGGVIEAESGYTGGRTQNPTYRQVANGYTGHLEAVRVTYDPMQVSYAQLVEYFWRHIDPTEREGQFCDFGPEYRSAIFWQTDAERQTAEGSRESLIKSARFAQVHTEILPTSIFWPAETYHQDYYLKNPLRYQYYRFACGRDERVQQLWGSG